MLLSKQACISAANARVDPGFDPWLALGFLANACRGFEGMVAWALQAARFQSCGFRPRATRLRLEVAPGDPLKTGRTPGHPLAAAEWVK